MGVPPTASRFAGPTGMSREGRRDAGSHHGAEARRRGAASRRLRRSRPHPPRDPAVMPPAGAVTERARPCRRPRMAGARTAVPRRMAEARTALPCHGPPRKCAVRRSPGRIWPEVHAPGTMRGLVLSGSRRAPRSGLAGIMSRANTGRRQASTGRQRARFRPGSCGY